MAANDRALVVGISRYPSLGALQGPEHDAQAFAAWLTSADGGDVPAGRVSLIVSSTFPEADRPTAEAIDGALGAIIKDAVANGGRRLYLYFAGHGFAPLPEDAAILMANAERDSTGFHIPGRAYTNWFRLAALFDEVVFLMDCCREVRTQSPAHPPPWNQKIGLKPARVFMGFATDVANAARERPSKINGQVVRGRFTEAIVDGLKHARDRSVPGARVTSRSLADFVFNRLQAEADQAGEIGVLRQEPRFEASDPIVFSEAAQPIRLRITSAVGPRPTLIGGDLAPIPPSATPSDTVTEWQVSPGLYEARGAAVSKSITLTGMGAIEDVTL